MLGMDFLEDLRNCEVTLVVAARFCVISTIADVVCVVKYRGKGLDWDLNSMDASRTRSVSFLARPIQLQGTGRCDILALAFLSDNEGVLLRAL